MSDQLAAVLVALHAVAAVIWVGGMFFASMVLRPVSVDLLEPTKRLQLWQRCFQRFFTWVWISIAVLLLTGFWLMFGLFGGADGAGHHVHLMLVLGLVMTALFAYIWFLPYRRLGFAVSVESWAEAAAHLGRIRQIIAVNLVLGLTVIAIGSGGRL